jgi:hypothetical protein
MSGYNGFTSGYCQTIDKSIQVEQSTTTKNSNDLMIVM